MRTRKIVTEAGDQLDTQLTLAGCTLHLNKETGVIELHNAAGTILAAVHYNSLSRLAVELADLATDSEISCIAYLHKSPTRGEQL